VVPRFRKSATHGSKEASIVNTWVFGGKNELIIAAQNPKGNKIHTKNLLASMAPPGPTLTPGSTIIAEPTWAGSSVRRRPTPPLRRGFFFRQFDACRRTSIDKTETKNWWGAVAVNGSTRSHDDAQHPLPAPHCHDDAQLPIISFSHFFHVKKCRLSATAMTVLGAFGPYLVHRH
jgi:hypothetical protein